MGQCAATPLRKRSAQQLCGQQPELCVYFRHGELAALDHIVEQWAQGALQGIDARRCFHEKVLRGQVHVLLGLQSSGEAAAQAGFLGAARGAEVGHGLARSLTSALGAQFPRRTSGRANNSASPAQVLAGSAAQAFGLLGAFAGGLVAGVGHAVEGGARAGSQTRRIFAFVDRVFMRASHEHAWELAAQQLELLGVPSWQENRVSVHC